MTQPSQETGDISGNKEKHMSYRQLRLTQAVMATVVKKSVKTQK